MTRCLIVLLGCLWALRLSAVSLAHKSLERLTLQGLTFISTADHKDSALIYFGEIARRYYENPRDKSLRRAAVVAFSQLANFHISPSYGYGKAYEYLHTACQLAEEEQMNDELSHLCISMGAIIFNNEQSGSRTAEAERWFKRGWAIARQHHQDEALVMIAFNMAVFSQDHHAGAFNSELKTFLSLPISREEESYNQTYAFVKGIFALQRGAFAQAYGWFEQSLGAVDSLSYTYKESRRVACVMAMTTALVGEGQVEAGAKLLKSHIAATMKMEPGSDALFLYKKLVDIYRQAGLEDSARVWDYRYMRIRDNADALAAQQNMARTELMAQIDHANEQARELSAARHHRQIAVIAVAATLVVMLALGMMWLVVRRQRQRQRQLFEENKVLLADMELIKAQRVEQMAARPKYEGSPISEEMSSELYDHLLSILDVSAEIYSPKFTLDKLAELAGSRPRYVSQVINERYEGGFAQLLADYRIREACRRLQDKAAYGNQTVEAIAQSVGIMSRSTFSHIFKRMTGLTPAAYRREAEK